MPKLENAPWQRKVVDLVIEEHLLAKKMLKLFAMNLWQYKNNVTHLSAKYLNNIELLNDKLKELQIDTKRVIIKQTQTLLGQWQIVINHKNIKLWTNLIGQLTNQDDDYRISYDTATKKVVQSYLPMYQPQISFTNYQQWVNTAQIKMPALQSDILNYFTWLEKFETILIKLA